MNRHFRRYCFALASRLKMTVKRLLKELDSHEIAEWMAYDMTCNQDWIKQYEHDQELERSKQMSPEEKLAAFKALLKGKP